MGCIHVLQLDTCLLWDEQNGPGNFFLSSRFKGKFTYMLQTVFLLLIFRGTFWGVGGGGGGGPPEWIQDLCSTGNKTGIQPVSRPVEHFSHVLKKEICFLG